MATNDDDADVRRILEKRATMQAQKSAAEAAAIKLADDERKAAQAKEDAVRELWPIVFHDVSQKVGTFEASKTDLGAGAHIFWVSPNEPTSPFKVQIGSIDTKRYYEIEYRITDNLEMAYKVISHRGPPIQAQIGSSAGLLKTSKNAVETFVQIFEVAAEFA